ncbi:DUF3558 domain-containing protein [Streptomyces sp. NPDC056437]|uniref:DUF3558 domain-containing protein n=1 Tax=Streptomyces sp. NPDC056437 TaxID=3345816 RepID=UPI00369C6919
MQRKAYVPGLAALLAVLVAGCSGGDGSDGSATDSKAGEGTQSVAEPGKYRTLLEPCGSVERGTLKDLLPGTAELPDEQQQRIFRGTAAVTYDTDRRVGCNWKADSPDASHTLSLDFERVVSYDTSVSDDDRAQEVFAKKQAGASLPVAEDPRDEKGKASPPAGTPSGPASPSGSPSPGASTGTDGPSATPEGLEPRALDSLGDAAFLDDVLNPAGAGSTAQRRTVSVVFRTSNVIVTIVYREQPARTTEVPDSKELQEKAQSLARNLVEQFSA